MPSTWQGILNKYGRDTYHEKQIRAWVRKNFATPLLELIRNWEAGLITKDEYEQLKDTLIFTYKQMQKDLHDNNLQDGWHAFDGQNRLSYPKYNAVVGFFSKERKKLKEAIEVIATSDRFQNMRDSGAEPDDLFRHLAINCLEAEIYPLVADAPLPYMEGEVKILERADFQEIIHNRTTRIASEIKEKVERTKAIEDSGIPVLGDLQKPTLEDGSLFSLPSATTCDRCGRILLDQDDLVSHYREEHPD